MNLGNRPYTDDYYAEGNYEMSDAAEDSLEGAINLHIHSGVCNVQEHLNSGVPVKALKLMPHNVTAFFMEG